MTGLLVVAGPVPVSDGVWNVEVPTDGEPQCGRKSAYGTFCVRTWGHEGHCDDDARMTVGRWGEVDCPSCPRGGLIDVGQGLGVPCRRCDGTDRVGAVTHLVTVAGPTHHAAAAGHWTEGYCSEAPPEGPEAATGWHTPVGEVVALDVPYPMERPTEVVGPSPGTWAWADDLRRQPASSWWGVLPAEVTT